MPKTFENDWVFESFLEDLRFVIKPMFGGKAAYRSGKLVLCLMENDKDSKWQGILVPTEHEHHRKLIEIYPALSQHQVLKKWLYLPMSHDDFEQTAESLIQAIDRESELLGVYPKPKSRKKSKSKSNKTKVRKKRKKKVYQC